MCFHARPSVHPILSFSVHNLFSESASPLCSTCFEGSVQPRSLYLLAGDLKGGNHGPALSGILVQVGKAVQIREKWKATSETFPHGQGGDSTWRSRGTRWAAKWTHLAVILGALKSSGTTVLYVSVQREDAGRGSDR